MNTGKQFEVRKIGNQMSAGKDPVLTISMKRFKDMGDQSFSFITDSAISMGAEQTFVYEQMIQKLESDVRNHIKVENQLKLILGKIIFIICI